MKRIRNSIFETNSSSTHTLAIVKENRYVIPDHIRFDFGEYGWGCDQLDCLKDKADYLITGIFSSRDEAQTKEWLTRLGNILDSLGVSYSFPEPKWVPYEASDGGYFDFDGYVDHGDELYDFIEDILNDPDKLARFLFDDRSYVTLSNDNELGYNIPGIGYEDSYFYDRIDEWNEKLSELQKRFDFYFKGN